PSRPRKHISATGSFGPTDRPSGIIRGVIEEGRVVATAVVDAPALSPGRTPRPTFQLTRRLVGVSKWPLALLTAAYAINISDQYLLPAVFPLLKEEFRLSDTALGFL